MDEVGELNLTMQVKLLRAIEGGGYTPIGGRAVRQADLRIVAATNRNLRASLDAGRFRKDFYYRIHILPIYLPSLKSRKEDIPLLVNHFVNDFPHGDKLPVVPQRIIAAMQEFDWPGNVRELQNTVQRYITLGKIDFLDLPPDDPKTQTVSDDLVAAQPDGFNQPLSEAVRAFEKGYIQHLLNENHWHRSRVARLLGVDRRTLFRKMKSLGL